MVLALAKGTLQVATDIEGAKEDIGGLGGALKNLVNPTTVAVAGLGAVSALVTKSIVDTTQYANSLHLMGERIQATPEFLSQMDHALGLSGIELDEYADAAIVAAERVLELSDGTGPLAERVEELGLSYDVLKDKTPTEALEALLVSLNNLDDPTRAAAIASELLSDQGVKLLPFFEMGAEGAARLREEADALGVTISTETAADAAELSENMGELSARFTAAQQAIGEKLLPILNDLFVKFEENILPVLEERLMPALQNLGEKLLPALEVAFKVIGPVIEEVFNRVIIVFEIFAAALSGDWAKLWEGLKELALSPLRVIEGIFGNFGISLQDTWIGVLRGIENLANLAIDGINTLIQNYNKIPFLPDVSELNRFSFGSGLETSSERLARYRDQTSTVSAGAFAGLAAGESRSLGRRGVADSGGQAAVQLNVANLVLSGSSEYSQQIVEAVQRADRGGFGL